MDLKTDLIVLSARQNMQVKVKNRLGAVVAGIIKQLDAVNADFFGIEAADFPGKVHDLIQDFLRDVKNVFVMLFRDHQRVIFGNRMRIQERQAVLTFLDDPGRDLFVYNRAKDAILHGLLLKNQFCPFNFAFCRIQAHLFQEVIRSGVG